MDDAASSSGVFATAPTGAVAAAAAAAADIASAATGVGIELQSIADEMDPALSRLAGEQQLLFAGGALFRALLALTPSGRLYFTVFRDSAMGVAVGLIALTGIGLRGNRQFHVLVAGKPAPDAVPAPSIGEAAQALATMLAHDGLRADFGQPCVCDEAGRLVSLPGAEGVPIAARELCEGAFSIFHNPNRRLAWQQVVDAAVTAATGQPHAVAWRSVYADVCKAVDRAGAAHLSVDRTTLATGSGGRATLPVAAGSGQTSVMSASLVASAASVFALGAAPPGNGAGHATTSATAGPPPNKRARVMSQSSADALGILATAAQSWSGRTSAASAANDERPAGALLKLPSCDVHLPPSTRQTSHVRAAILAAEHERDDVADDGVHIVTRNVVRVKQQRGQPNAAQPSGPRSLALSDTGAFVRRGGAETWWVLQPDDGVALLMPACCAASMQIYTCAGVISRRLLSLPLSLPLARILFQRVPQCLSLCAPTHCLLHCAPAHFVLRVLCGQ